MSNVAIEKLLGMMSLRDLAEVVIGDGERVSFGRLPVIDSTEGLPESRCYMYNQAQSAATVRPAKAA